MKLLSKHRVSVTGSGEQAIVFSHGFGCNQSMFRHMVDAFSDDYRVVLYDLAGAGDYDMAHWNPDRYHTLHGYGRDLNAILDELELDQVHFIGHSVSAMIGALASIERPELYASLSMIGPSPRYTNEGDYYGGFSEADIDELLDTMDGNYLGWSSAMAPAIVGNPERPGLGEELTNTFCQTDPDAARHFATVTFKSDNRADLPRVTHPTLILQCSEDIIAPEAVGEYVHRQIAGSRYILLEARGHCPNLSAPSETSTAILDFLATHRRAA